MIVVSRREDLTKAVQLLRTKGKTIGFVPTMGALHQGHLSLVDASKKNNDITIVSIFVNPTQFGPKEDFSKYPRTLEKDLDLISAKNVDLVFTPSTEDIYPPGYSVYIEEENFSKVLCGPFRPGHFRGVCTVVFKLLAAAKPHRLYLGQKDAQQLRILQKMVEELNLDVEVLGCPTLREADGLAMSSRNTYLTAEERKAAPNFYQALLMAKNLFDQGERRGSVLQSIAMKKLSATPEFSLQYLELRRWKTLEEVEEVADTCILAGALHLGRTRLIDNIFLTPGKP